MDDDGRLVRDVDEDLYMWRKSVVADCFFNRKMSVDRAFAKHHEEEIVGIHMKRLDERC